jgi:hypothetical protein
LYCKITYIYILDILPRLRLIRILKINHPLADFAGARIP